MNYPTRGRKSTNGVLAPQQTPATMRTPPTMEPAGKMTGKHNTAQRIAGYGTIMNELGHTKSRIYEVR